MTNSLIETNRLLSENINLLELVARDDIGSLLSELDYEWSTGSINVNAKIFRLMADGGLASVEGGGRLNRFGMLFLSRLLIHFDVANHGDRAFGSLNEKYSEFKLISAGKNSIVVSARHNLLGSRVVVKILRPGASENIVQSIRKLGSINLDSAIVRPIDFVEASVADVAGKPVTLSCIVFPLIGGKTFRDFLQQENHHLNSQVVMSFSRQVGNALAELERLGAYHGDLHERNILVDHQSEGVIRFRIIDISFDAMGSLPFEACRNNDISNFKQHVWRILSLQRRFLPNMSLRKYIGTKNYIKITRILSAEAGTFIGVMHVLSDDSDYNSYANDRSRFIANKFRAPITFRLQRYEEITDHSVAVRLFVPFEPLMEKIREFSNVYVSGNRGSGKSTYLASLAFFAEMSEEIVDFRSIFGIYFPCRQGEFKGLATRPGWTSEIDRISITNIIVIKVIRRTLETIASGIASGKISSPSSLGNLREFVNSLLPAPGIVSVDHDIQSDIENLVATMIRVEMEEIRTLPSGNPPKAGGRDTRSLIEFFKVIKEAFFELSSSRFHLLFDDAGTPYVPSNVQKVINDLIITSNPYFCVKLSAEKLTFDFESSDAKVLENGQDYYEHDISSMLFIGSGNRGLNRTGLESYFRKIVEQRLQHFSFQSHNIVDYLGDEQSSGQEMTNLLAQGRRDAYYCGWTTVWNIADRTPRNLLEIVSEIFSVANVERDTCPNVVSRRDQDRAIRTISEKRLESLSQIAGTVKVFGETVSLGRRLFEVTVAIGSTFRSYLRAEHGKKQMRQHLAIERNDLGDLTVEADTLLKRLITFGVLDSGRMEYARDDQIKKPIYVLNRIYCPAFQISYRRDDHLRLSTGKIEMLLLSPERFLREGTKRLLQAGAPPRDLFNYREDL